jgi:hypothetical protein
LDHHVKLNKVLEIIVLLRENFSSGGLLDPAGGVWMTLMDGGAAEPSRLHVSLLPNPS